MDKDQAYLLSDYSVPPLVDGEQPRYFVKFRLVIADNFEALKSGFLITETGNVQVCAWEKEPIAEMVMNYLDNILCAQDEKREKEKSKEINTQGPDDICAKSH